MISIHALHEESDKHPRGTVKADVIISIHALHEESDLVGRGAPKGFQISIHALHEESDLRPLHIYLKFATFQSTLSMRRATGVRFFTARPWYFNPRSP